MFTERLSRRRSKLILLLTLAAVGFWLGHSLLFRYLAEAWIVADVPQKADAIVILGGGVDTRPQLAAQLYHQGFASVILIMQPNPTFIKKFNALVDNVPLTIDLLRNQNVPIDAIKLLEPNVENTFEEAVVLTRWAKNSGSRKFLVPTDVFHTRRVAWVFERQLRAINAKALVIPAVNQQYSASDWWRSGHGVRNFFNEIFKHAFYLIRY